MRKKLAAKKLAGKSKAKAEEAVPVVPVWQSSVSDLNKKFETTHQDKSAVKQITPQILPSKERESSVVRKSIHSEGNKPRSVNQSKKVEPAIYNKNQKQETNDEFKKLCRDFLLLDGFKITEPILDLKKFSVDYVASKYGRQYVIQCRSLKNIDYEKDVKNILYGKALINADVAIIMTNALCPKKAKMVASNYEILIWDREYILRDLHLKDMVKKYPSSGFGGVGAHDDIPG